MSIIDRIKDRIKKLFGWSKSDNPQTSPKPAAPKPAAPNPPVKNLEPVNQADLDRLDMLRTRREGLRKTQAELDAAVRRLDGDLSIAKDQRTRLERQKNEFQTKQKELTDRLAARSKRDGLIKKQRELNDSIQSLGRQIQDQNQKKDDLGRKKQTLLAEKKELIKASCIKIEATEDGVLYIKVVTKKAKEKEDCPPSFLSPCIVIPDSCDALPPVDGDEIDWLFGGSRSGKVICAKDAPRPGQTIFIIGDIHGDYETLKDIVTNCLIRSPGCGFLFLGDLIDRGKQSLACVRFVVWLAKKLPGHVLWLKGNHDTLAFSEAANVFVSDASPCEFAEELNAQQELLEEGQRIAELMADLPLGCLLGDAWISHGGVIHSDEIGKLTSFDALSSNAASDFVWTRMVDAKAKMVNRATKGADAGFEQAKGFADKVKELLGVEIRHFVCGHQHTAADHAKANVRGAELSGIAEDKFRARYIEYSRFFGEEKGLTCQVVASFREEGDVTLPAILEWRSNVPKPVPAFVN